MTSFLLFQIAVRIRRWRCQFLGTFQAFSYCQRLAFWPGGHLVFPITMNFTLDQLETMTNTWPVKLHDYMDWCIYQKCQECFSETKYQEIMEWSWRSSCSQCWCFFFFICFLFWKEPLSSIIRVMHTKLDKNWFSKYKCRCQKYKVLT